MSDRNKQQLRAMNTMIAARFKCVSYGQEAFAEVKHRFEVVNPSGIVFYRTPEERWLCSCGNSLQPFTADCIHLQAMLPSLRIAFGVG